jgi:hypothetical protein
LKPTPGPRSAVCLSALASIQGPYRGLSSDEGRAPRGTTLLAVPVGKQAPFFGDAVDVGCAVAHHAQIAGAHVELADVVGHDHENVGLAAAW